MEYSCGSTSWLISQTEFARLRAHIRDHILRMFVALTVAADWPVSFDTETTQSAFKGSNRYYRGQVLKLLQEGELTMAKLGKRLDLEKDALAGILAQLETDRLVSRQGTRVFLPRE